MPIRAERDGRGRAVVDNVWPQVDGGRFPIKRAIGDEIVVLADVFCDGHGVLRCAVLYGKADATAWAEAPMRPLGNDRWTASFVVDELGRWAYTVEAWVDPFATWRHDLARRSDAKDIAVALQVGAELVRAAARRAPGAAGVRLAELARALAGAPTPKDGQRLGTDEELAALMARHAERPWPVRYEPVLPVVVDPVRARFSTWYEMFPRSCTDDPARHGTFADCERRLPYVASMGFDVLYLPPIHPIGRTARKGPNNALVAGPDDPGSPWAIGAAEGGHTAVHPALGTLEDFRRLVAAARTHGIEVALDLAFQCSPDHPWVREHPAWFRWRPDGTVQYAENPPKKYQDIYPFDFETAEWRELWTALKAVVEFWIAQGVRIFRVDNPHTKPFAFWEWLIDEIKRSWPEVIFLSEAFTRPKIMHRLAKLGFTQSYTYFAWRNTRAELVEYFTELAQSPAREYFRPNVWPNTPDILTEFLQYGGRPAFLLRVALAATLSASYGIYGPAFELLEHVAREPGSEEYRDSEKYQIRVWDLDRPDSLRHYIARLNAIRRENPALHSDWSLAFHPTDNDRLLCYSKASADLANIVLVVANLDPHHVQSGWVELPLERFGLEPDRPFQVHDLLAEARYLWHGARNFVRLDPHAAPVHVFRVRRKVRTEHDFDYYL